VLIFGIILSQNKAVMEKDHLSINVLDENNKDFCRSINIFIPAEIGYNGKINVEK